MPGLISERHSPADTNAGGRDSNGLTTPKKLLVIDDEAGICAVIARVAEGLGLTTKIAPEPLNAAEFFADFAPDAVILDMIMPGKDGIGLLHEMLLTGVPAKFILMSGYGDTYMRLAKGVAAFHGVEPPAMLSKPFRRDVLMTSLRAAMSMETTHPANDVGK